ncbi:MAG: PEP-CTERM sorting domain-containing protein [Phycisphaerae bacterium]|nr:PEP-CTERM sorting domain-containing protein [Phycisphaerae bacterium]
MRSKVLAIGCVMTVFLVCVSSAQAVLITHSTAGTLVSDGFEGVRPGSDPDSNIWTTVDAGSALVEVVNDASPGPYSGSQYLYSYRGTNAATVTANFTDVMALGGTLHFEAMVYTKYEDGTYYGKPRMDFADVIYIGAGLKNNPQENIYVYNGSAFVDSGLDITYNQWQKWEIDYDIDAGSYEITLDGTSSGTLTHFAGGTTLDKMTLTHLNNYSPVYWDAVPEPMTCLLLSLGGVLCMVRKRK